MYHPILCLIVPQLDSSDHLENITFRKKKIFLCIFRSINEKIQPPFYGDIIEATIPVQPCQSYKFTLKIVTTRNAVLGEIKNIQLPKLSAIPNFRPPKLSKMFKIEQNPLRLAMSSGFEIPSTCMSEFLHAGGHPYTKWSNFVYFLSLHPLLLNKA